MKYRNQIKCRRASASKKQQHSGHPEQAQTKPLPLYVHARSGKSPVAAAKNQFLVPTCRPRQGWLFQTQKAQPPPKRPAAASPQNHAHPYRQDQLTHPRPDWHTACGGGAQWHKGKPQPR